MDDLKAAVASAAVPLTFRCVESKTKTDEHGRFSYSGLLSALDESGQHIDPRHGFPAKGSLHYAINGALAYPALEEGKCYRLAFVEVDDPAKMAEYQALVEGGMSDAEARATAWPEPAPAEEAAPETPVPATAAETEPGAASEHPQEEAPAKAAEE